MIPILYATLTEGTVPSHYGVGALTDCLACTVTEERNGQYELTLEYPSSGIHAEDIQPNSFIKAKPNFTDAPQLFRIYKVGKEMNGRFTCYGQHISYDLGGKVAPAGIFTNNAVNACYELTTRGGGNYTINTNISATRVFRTKVPAPTRSWFGGKEGSLLDIYGGEWKYDNYTCSLLASRGTDRGVQIRYGKNLTQLSQELDMTNLVTGVYGYAVNPNDSEDIVTGPRVATGLVLDVPHDIVMDFSNDIDYKNGGPVYDQLATLTAAYISRNSSSLINLRNSITLDFVQLKELQERVDLCDTVHIYFEALGISASAKCISTTWDVIRERYTSTSFGEARTNIADTISLQETKLENTPTISQLSNSVSQATQLITGNLGGYVVLHDGDGDGYPDEILVMDSPDIDTAVNVWRWNQNGLGFSANGYDGDYDTLALTSTGEIVADAIKTGVLNADLIKAGTISDAQGNSTIDMTNGIARMSNLKAISSFDLIESDNTIYASMGHSRPTEAHIYLLAYALLTGSTYNSRLTLQCDDMNNQGKSRAMLDATDGTSSLTLGRGAGSGSFTNCVFMYASNVGGYLNLRNGSGTDRVTLNASTYGGELYFKDGTKRPASLYADANGGNLYLRNYTNNNISAQLSTGSGNKDGILYLFKSDGTATIFALGHTGNITCVSLTQTSSRKVKENIKPIADAKKILELNAVSFDFKDKARGTDRRGFIAEEVAEVLPNLVTPEKGETPAALDYIGMIPYLQAVIKELEARVTKLEELLNGKDQH